MYTINAIKAVNSSFRKITKRGAFPNDNFPFKLLYLRVLELQKKWASRPIANWLLVRNQLLSSTNSTVNFPYLHNLLDTTDFYVFEWCRWCHNTIWILLTPKREHCCLSISTCVYLIFHNSRIIFLRMNSSLSDSDISSQSFSISRLFPLERATNCTACGSNKIASAISDAA